MLQQFPQAEGPPSMEGLQHDDVLMGSGVRSSQIGYATTMRATMGYQSQTGPYCVMTVLGRWRLRSLDE